MKEYYIKLINRIFAIIYIYEQDIENYEAYLDNLIIELSGNKEFEEIRRIYFKLSAIKDKNIAHKIVRKTIFDCINLVDYILSNWGLR